MPSHVWIHHVWYNVRSSIKHRYFSNIRLFFVGKCSKPFLVACLKQSACIVAVFVSLLRENTSSSFLCLLQLLHHRNESLRHCWYLAMTSVVNRDLDPLWHLVSTSASPLMFLDVSSYLLAYPLLIWGAFLLDSFLFPSLFVSLPEGRQTLHENELRPSILWPTPLIRPLPVHDDQEWYASRDIRKYRHLGPRVQRKVVKAGAFFLNSRRFVFDE